MNKPLAIPTAAVLVSGGGTNLQAIIDAIAGEELNLDLSVVVSNRASAGGLDRARRANIAVECVPHENYENRIAFDTALVETLDKYQPGFIILAGFMRILTDTFVHRYPGKILNIHPSLLPKHPGLHTHQRAIDAGDQWHGSTVHFVTEELDGGPVIIQGRVSVKPDDSAARLAARVLAVEHRLYPRAAKLVTSGRVACRDGAVWLDGQRLVKPLTLDS